MSPSFRGVASKTSQLVPKEMVKALVDPPTPIVELQISHGTKHSGTLREVAKVCRHNNWGVWQYDGDVTWSTVHKESTPDAPRLNCDPVEAIKISKPLFEASPACKSFTIETPAGVALSMADLERIEWTPLEELAKEPEPDRVDELEDQINELQSDKAAILARLDTLEATIKSLGKRKAPAIVADDDDEVEEPAPTPQTAGSSCMRSTRK